MSLTKFMCQNRSEIHSIFRKMKGWKTKVNEYSLTLEKSGLVITLQLVGPPIVLYSYGRSWISIHINQDGTERILGCEGDFEKLQQRVHELIK